jgi:hypothetical protein
MIGRGEQRIMTVDCPPAPYWFYLILQYMMTDAFNIQYRIAPPAAGGEKVAFDHRDKLRPPRV